MHSFVPSVVKIPVLPLVNAIYQEAHLNFESLDCYLCGMIQRVLLIPVLMVSFFCSAQEIKVEHDQGTDLTHYKTFLFGEGEIITPQDQRQVPDSIIHKWIRVAVSDELEKKGLHQSTAATSDLVISYIIGSQNRSDAGRYGPLGLTPGANPSQTYQRDYKRGSLVIDLNDPKTNKLVWRVNAIMNVSNPDVEGIIEQIVIKGFKKFYVKPKKEKRKN